RKSTEDLLRDLGYKVRLAEDGVEALALLDKNGEDIHLVLTDVLMPRMTGFELARRIAQRPTPPRVLFMSGHLDDQSMPQGGLPQGSFLLEKPFGLARLAGKVREALEATRPAPNVEN